MEYSEALTKLTYCGQEHLLKFYDELSPSEKTSLLSQIEQIDFSEAGNLFSRKYAVKVNNMRPIDTLRVEDKEKKAALAEIGRGALIRGKMGIVILSGGQGSRLGFDHAKGMYNVGLEKNITIFELHIQRLVRFREKEGVCLHCFIMTSLQNNDEIKGFFEDNNYFGYDKNYVHFYTQGNNITVDKDLRPMLSTKSSVCYSPNGNGRFYTDLTAAGFGKLLGSEGIEWLNVVSVDNVLQNFIDPAFLGAVVDADAGCGAKVVKKAGADEKIGVICMNDGHPDVLEYYEIPDDLKGAADSDGELLYSYGVILNYLFKVSELENINYDELPVHVANKKVSYVGEGGDTVIPTSENAWKFEYLLTDLISRTSSCVSFEVEREKEFAPIKNLTGKDSVESARALLMKNNYTL